MDEVRTSILATVAMPDALFGLAIFGPLIKKALLGYLRGIKDGGAPAAEDEAPSTTDRKVRAADKIAAIMMGGGVLFAAGLLAGLFAGLLDGIVGPILLVAMLIQFVVGALAMAVQFAHSTGQEIFGTGEGATAEEPGDDEALAEEVTDYLATQGLEELVPPTADNLQELEAAFEETRGQDTAFDQAQASDSQFGVAVSPTSSYQSRRYLVLLSPNPAVPWPTNHASSPPPFPTTWSIWRMAPRPDRPKAGRFSSPATPH